MKQTLGGGLRANLEALKDLYPNAIILSTPLPSHIFYLRPYIPNTCMWIEKMADYYSIPVIDAYSESGILAELRKDGRVTAIQETEQRGNIYLMDYIQTVTDINC